MPPKKCGGSAGKKVVKEAVKAVVPKFVVSTINWKELKNKVPPNQMTQFLAFKAKSDNYLRRVNASPVAAPPIDWEYYKKTVPVEGLVDKFKTEYEGFKVPRPSDTLTQSIDEQWTKIQEEIKKYKEENGKHIEKANKEIARIKALPDFENMTMEMFVNMYPEHAPDYVKKPTHWPHDKDNLKIYIPKS